MNSESNSELASLPPLRAGERVYYGGLPSQFFDLWRPAPLASRGAVVMIHGGFWRSQYDLSHTSYLCAALARNGIATASIEYRRVGEPGGGWPQTFEDVVAGFGTACKHFSQPNHVVVLGHSAGGHLALRLANEAIALRGVVALAPAACLELVYRLKLGNGAVAEFLGGTPQTVPEAYAAACPSRHASPVPRILVHGTADEIVPISVSKCFLQSRASDSGAVSIVEVPGAGHFDLIDPASRAWPVVLGCVSRFFE